MRAPLLFLVALGLPMAPAGAAEARTQLILERSIPLENVSGRIDHMAVDIAGKRLFVAELGNNSVDVIDLVHGKVVGRINGLKEPQGVVYIPDQDLIIVTSAKDGSVRFFRAANLSPLGTIRLGDDADNIRIDATTGHVLVGYGSGALAVIDATRQTQIADIKLAAHPEGFEIDPKTNRAFVNVPDDNKIVVIDLQSRKQSAAWKAPSLRSNFPMALADAGGPLAVVFRSPAALVLLDPATGMVMQRLDICGDADDVFFDDKRHRLYVSCGEGAIDVMERNNLGFQQVGRVKTPDGARTSLFVPALDRLFVAAPAGWFGSPAELLVFRLQ